MQAGLGRFMQVFADQGVSERVRFLYPNVSENGRSIDTMVHSKVMIVDDSRAAGRLGQPEQPLVRRRHRMRSRLRGDQRRSSQADRRRARPPGRPFLRRERERGRGGDGADRLAHQGGRVARAERPQPRADRARSMRRPARSRRSRNSAIPSARSRRRNSPSPSSASGRRRAASAASRRSSPPGCSSSC